VSKLQPDSICSRHYQEMNLLSTRRIGLAAATSVAVAAIMVIGALPSGAAPKLVKVHAASVTATPIKHVVVIFQENVSFDHRFGTYPNATNQPGEPQFHPSARTPSVNGLNENLLTSNPNTANPQRLDRSQPLTCDQDHDYTPEEQAFDHGLMDKFVQFTNNVSCSPPDISLPGLVMDYCDGNTVTASAHHEPFQYYSSTANPSHNPPSSVNDRQERPGQPSVRPEGLLGGGQARQPALCVVPKAARYQDGHAGYSDPLDEQHFVVNTINRLETTADWKNTAVVIAYDDSDGWYDHQMSPIVNHAQDRAYDALTDPGLCGTAAPAGGYQDRCGYGPRLPLLVISPYARGNSVDHSITDQPSILRFIEDNWGTGQIGKRLVRRQGRNPRQSVPVRRQARAEAVPQSAYGRAAVGGKAARPQSEAELPGRRARPARPPARQVIDWVDRRSRRGPPRRGPAGCR
jgi:hypothetical protein